MKYNNKQLKKILLDDINTILNQLNECKNQLLHYDEIEGDFDYTVEILQAVYGNFGDKYTYQECFNQLLNGGK